MREARPLKPQKMMILLRRECYSRLASTMRWSEPLPVPRLRFKMTKVYSLRAELGPVSGSSSCSR